MDIFVSATAGSIPFKRREAPTGAEIVICTDPTFAGDCAFIFIPQNNCTEFPTGFLNDVSSVENPSDFDCTLYM